MRVEPVEERRSTKGNNFIGQKKKSVDVTQPRYSQIKDNQMLAKKLDHGRTKSSGNIRKNDIKNNNETIYSMISGALASSSFNIDKIRAPDSKKRNNIIESKGSSNNPPSGKATLNESTRSEISCKSSNKPIKKAATVTSTPIHKRKTTSHLGSVTPRYQPTPRAQKRESEDNKYRLSKEQTGRL